MVHDIAVLPNFEPDELTSPVIPAFQYQRGLKEEIDSGSIAPGEAMDMLEWMMSIRAFEEMILALRMQAFPETAHFGWPGKKSMYQEHGTR